ncbi:DNA cytosine methyltransferase [Curtobacterium sp. MCBD17_026]|uniref:DNA cytosine methyltransferase n=1 Tax=Curtobacterium sp. MCBD17_026 TaxID=2175621 RepID=UPI000DA8D036|nr:DNA cytosine methyltransferase [Curtobacterium sp. MCBD17_026]WIB69584.1 DNA cytosine methyltransferase [Curtobacterium sp. MCBD17_026]
MLLEVTTPEHTAETATEQTPLGDDFLSQYAVPPVGPNALGTFISLYAGAGGLDIGFSLAGFKPVWVNELDANAAQTHRSALGVLAKQMPHLDTAQYDEVVGDLSLLDDDLVPKKGAADLIIGGPPCQGFSVGGKMDPLDPRSRHVFKFLDIVARVQPKAFVLENVKALYSNRRWAGTRAALERRGRGLGYKIRTILLNAADYGVPQSRERMFMIGVRQDLPAPVVPVPTTSEGKLTVRDALSQLPPFGSVGNDTFCVAQIKAAKVPVLRKSPYAGMLFNGAGRPLNLDSPSGTLPATMGGNRTPIIDQDWLEGKTTTSWVVGHHSTRLNNEAHEEVPGSLRRLTVEEAAALQTFPLAMTWHGPVSSQFRQIGNAVPPRLALAVAQMLRDVVFV